MNELDQIQKELNEIKSRNQKVEDDKAWETSWTRRAFIIIATYIIAVIWLKLIDDSKAYLNALVPSLGYGLSTISIPFIKNRWIRRHLNK